MTIFSIDTAEFAWSVTIAVAWIVGEIGHRFTQLPRISFYGLVGFLAANSHWGFLSQLDNSLILLPANIAFGLILFEFGYHINLRWLKLNPWIAVTGLVEACATFGAVYALCLWFGLSTFISLSLAALTTATSPAEVLRVINELRSSGQVTERIFHLTALNCVLAILAFNIIVVFWIEQPTTNLFQIPIDSAIMILTSFALGALFGLVLPIVLRYLGNLPQEVTIAFALAVILLVALAHAAKLSPMLAALTFGLMARNRRVVLSNTKRNFGALGDLLTIVLFVFVTSTLEWERVVTGAGLGLAIFAVRLCIKTLTTTALAPVSGITVRKGMLTGLGLAPISVFVILTLEQARYSGIALIDELSTLEAIAGMILLLEIIGPIITQCAILFANETHER